MGNQASFEGWQGTGDWKATFYRPKTSSDYIVEFDGCDVAESLSGYMQGALKQKRRA
jgi:hypothetical protein